MAQVKLSKVRIAFVDVFKPSEKFDKYGLVAIIEPKSENVKTLDAAVDLAAKEKWGAKAEGILKAIKAKDDCGWHKAAKMSSSGEEYDGFQGMYHVNTTNSTKPTVLDRDKTPLDASSGKPYSGCYCNLIIECWAQDNSWGKKINFSLKGVQFHSDGEAFSGGGVASEDDFDDIADGADSDML